MAILVFLSSCDPSVEIISVSGDFSDLVYDSTTAQKYGADEYGMKKYIMAFLKRGPNRNLDADSSQALQMAHLENFYLKYLELYLFLTILQIIIE